MSETKATPEGSEEQPTDVRAAMSAAHQLHMAQEHVEHAMRGLEELVYSSVACDEEVFVYVLRDLRRIAYRLGSPVNALISVANAALVIPREGEGEN